MVEDEVVAAQLEALVTPAITAQENYYRRQGRARPNTQPTIDGGSAPDSTVARCGRSQGIKPHLRKRRFVMVSPHTGKSTSSFSKIFDFSG